MKKISFAIILSMIIFSLVACTEVSEETQINHEYIYDSSYKIDRNFLVEIINEVYFDYHDVFAGVYIDDGVYNLNITNETPRNIVKRLEQTGLVRHHIVDFSFYELWTVKEIVISHITEIDGIIGIGISEKDNSVIFTVKTGTVIPSSFFHYIETGILTVDFTDLIITNT